MKAFMLSLCLVLCTVVWLPAAGPPPEWREVAETVRAEILRAHRLRQSLPAAPVAAARLDEIERCYQRALLFEPVLRRISARLCGEMLAGGTAPEACRPTLYDHVVHDLLDFYLFAIEQGGEGERMRLAAEGPAFADTAEFLEDIPAVALRESRVLRALRFYQDLLRFHEEDEERMAYADADLNRLLFCHAVAGGGLARERYAVALERFCGRWRKLELMARATALRARLAEDEDQPALARMLAQNGAALFPDSLGAAACRHIIARIEAPALELRAPPAWGGDGGAVSIVYRNLRRVDFKVVAAATDDPAAHTGRAAVLRWGASLPPSGDFRMQRHLAKPPQQLPAGDYFIFATPESALLSGRQPCWALRIRCGAAAGTEAEPVPFKLVGAGWAGTEAPKAWRYHSWR